MGVTKFIKRISVQTAVYWGQPIPTGYGRMQFLDVKEIKVRWDDTTELIRNRFGKEVASKARLLVNEDLHEEGYLYLGTLDSLTEEQIANPLAVEKAFPIARIDKNPLIKSTTKFVRTVYL